MTTSDAVKKLVQSLKEDPSYHYSWQSSIAMAFMDQLNDSGYKLPDQHIVANEAAKRFLTLLMMDVVNDHIRAIRFKD